MPIEEYRSTKTISVVVRALVIVVGFTHFLYILAWIVQINAFDDLLFVEKQRTDIEIAVVLLIYSLGWLITLITLGLIVTFLIWQYQSYKNLIAFGISNLYASAGWSVGSWFVPFVNLWIPLRSINELHNDSEADLVGEVTVFSDSSTPTIHGLWWAAWIISGFATRISGNIGNSARSESEFFVAIVIDLGASAGFVFAAYLLFEIVGEITRRQTAVGEKSRSKDLDPPEPDQFGAMNPIGVPGGSGLSTDDQ